MESNHTKDYLRQWYKEKRKLLSSADIVEMSEQIFKRYLLYLTPKRNDSIHVFLPIQRLKEINTQLWIRYFWENEVKVFVPKIVGNTLISVQYNEDTPLIKNRWGIEEPKGTTDECMDFQQILTPLLYTDSDGNRIGYGKGFYDRFFQRVDKGALKIGLNYFPPGEQIVVPYSTDVPLDYLVTPEEIVSFGSFGLKSTK